MVCCLGKKICQWDPSFRIQHHSSIVYVLPHGCPTQNHQVICLTGIFVPSNVTHVTQKLRPVWHSAAAWCGQCTLQGSFIFCVKSSNWNIEISSDSKLPHVTSCHPTKLIRTPNIGWPLDDLKKSLTTVGMLTHSDFRTFDLCVVLDGASSS